MGAYNEAYKEEMSLTKNEFFGAERSVAIFHFLFLNIKIEI